MPPESIREMLDRRPFVPFRVHVGNERSYVVAHPEWCLVGYEVIVIGLKNPGSQSEFFDRPVFVTNSDITRLEPLVDEIAN